MYPLDEVLIHLAPNKIIKAFRYFVFEYIIQIINLPRYLWKYSTDGLLSNLNKTPNKESRLNRPQYNQMS